MRFELRLKNIGYYIMEPAGRPKHVSLECENLFSASPCICDMHPDLRGCFWQGYEKEKTEYRKKLLLTSDEFTGLKRDVAKWFQEKRLDVDSRFTALADAVDFYERYLKSRPDTRIIGVSTTENYISVLSNEALWCQNAPMSEEAISGRPLGGEILGFDYGSFHSYLCNGLEKELQKEFRLLCDPGTGLIQNHFEEMEQFAERIQGKGEPVEWIPVLIHDHTPEK